MSDEVFLSEIRRYIDVSNHVHKKLFLDHVKEDQSNVNGKDYAVGLWILFDNTKSPPQKSNLPLMAKYELKMTYERLRNIHKYSSINLSMIPVRMIKFKTEKNGTSD